MAVSTIERAVNTERSGMLIMVAAVLLVPVGDTLSKLLTDVMDPVEIAFWRFGFQFLCLCAIAAYFRPRLTGGSPVWLFTGGLTAGLTLLCLTSAFQVMPIATAIAIFFVEPLILTLLSGLILKERIGWRRYLAVAVGLVGAVIVIRPGWDVFGWRTLLPLSAAVAFAFNAISMRRASRELSSVAVQFWFALVAAMLLGVATIVTDKLSLPAMGWTGQTSSIWGQLVIMGALSALTFYLFSEAFKRTPAGVLAPFQYIEIIGATLMGYLVFGDFPDGWTWLGTIIILASGLYVFHRERKSHENLPHA